MTPLHFTKNDVVARVAAILDNSPEWVDADEVDTRALAHAIVDQMTCDGHAPETVSPLRYRTTYGLAAYLRLIADHTREEVNDVDLEDLAWDHDDQCASCAEMAEDDEDDEDSRPAELGDVLENGDGIVICTPHAYWRVSDEEALNLLTGLAATVRGRLTRPWSAEDDSTILTRGRALRRPVDQTTELASIADFHA